MRRNIPFLACLLATCPVLAPAQQVIFNFTGSAQTWVVPEGVTSISVDARGGMGGGSSTDALVLGGKGGRVQTSIAVTPGEILTIYVGGVGGDPVPQTNTAGVGGFNGGGNGGIDNYDANAPAAGGGGASDIRQGGSDPAHRAVVAGGGGGAECCEDGNGGAGGGLIGMPGFNYQGGGGGTQSAGGYGGGDGSSGSLGLGGLGGDGNRAGGGGGGGYYGGGGGGGNLYGSGGGGGSSYSIGTGTIHTQGFQSGNGQIIINVGSTPQGFLTFPLEKRNAYDAKIISVFDHHSNWQYCADGVVEAYDGETGEAQYGEDEDPTDPTCYLTGVSNLAYGFAQSDYIPFEVNHQYVGADGDGNGHLGVDFLEYDGHPAYDFKTTDQAASGEIPVLAAASGTVVCSNVTIPEKCTNSARVDPCIEGPGEIKIKHTNGYFSIYLHLSSSLVSAGEQVNAGQQIGVSGDTGVCGNPHLHFEIREATNNCGSGSSCVCNLKQTEQTNSCIPVDPYGWTGTPNTDPYTHAGKPITSIKLWQ